MSWIRVLFGRRLATDEQAEQKIGVLAGVPALGLDGLGSSAYGPGGRADPPDPARRGGARATSGRSRAPDHRPAADRLRLLPPDDRRLSEHGGGSYTVAKENLGTTAGLLAAAALMLDYVLIVAVGISAGVGALVSAVPVPAAVHALRSAWRSWPLITLVNLRGTRESGLAFALPTYLFVVSFFVAAGGSAITRVAARRRASAAGGPAAAAAGGGGGR